MQSGLALDGSLTDAIDITASDTKDANITKAASCSLIGIRILAIGGLDQGKISVCFVRDGQKSPAVRTGSRVWRVHPNLCLREFCSRKCVASRVNARKSSEAGTSTISGQGMGWSS